MYIFLSVAIVGILLVVNELWWKRSKNKSELSRKVIHILVGSFVAFWPLYISWDWIRLISLAFLIGVLLSKSLHIFTSIHEVDRVSHGEIFFAIAVGLVTFVTRSDWLFTIALLQMSLADGLAAIFGIRYGKKNRIKLFGSYKSVVGSSVFLISSLVIIFTIDSVAHLSFPIGIMILTSCAVTIVEIVGAYGTDNVLVPLVTTLLLMNH